MEARTLPNRAQRAPRGAQDTKKTKKNTEPTKGARWFLGSPHFRAKKWPTWLQVGLQIRSKIDEKSMQKSIKKTTYLGIEFWKDLGGFLDAKWRHVGTKVDQKSMPTSNNDFLKKPCFSFRKNNDFEGSGDRSWR